jgi:hypothetical protein
MEERRFNPIIVKATPKSAENEKTQKFAIGLKKTTNK